MRLKNFFNKAICAQQSFTSKEEHVNNCDASSLAGAITKIVVNNSNIIWLGARSKM